MNVLVVGIGELLWDIFPDMRTPGGAPANFIYHVQKLGCQGIIISRIGTDELGDKLVAFLKEKNLSIDYIQRDPKNPTGRVYVDIKNGEPTYNIIQNAAWDYIESLPSWKPLYSKISAVCFGSLAQRNTNNQRVIQKFLTQCPSSVLKILDLNLRSPFCDEPIILSTLYHADILKCNQEEINQLTRMLSSKDSLKTLFEHFGIKILCITKGKKGCAIYTSIQQKKITIPPLKVDTSIGDSVGVGDAFTAAFITHYLKHNHTIDAANFANHYAAQVATQRGAMN